MRFRDGSVGSTGSQGPAPPVASPVATSILLSRLGACATATVLGIAGAGANLGYLPSSVGATVAVAFVPYSALLLCDAGSRKSALGWSLVLAAGAGLVLVFSPSLLSDDVYRFLWDGRVAGAGIDPYRFPPDDPALAVLRDAYWERINHPSIATIYPPVAQLLFWFADRVAHAPASFKLLALLAHLAVTAVIGRVAESSRAPLLFGLNPLALSEAALGGHLDALAGLGVVGALVSLKAERPIRAAVSTALAVGLKLFAVLLAPVLLRRSRASVALLLLASGALAAPVLTAGYGSNRLGGFGHYARRWQGNEGGFALAEAVASACVSGVAWVGEAPDDALSLDRMRPVFVAVRDTPLDPWRGLVSEKKLVDDPAVFDRAVITAYLARLIVLVGVAVAALVLARWKDPWTATRWTLIGALFFAPQVHPWYLLWFLPLEAIVDRRAGFVWSAAVLVAYAPLDRWLVDRSWEESALARVLEYGVFLSALAIEALPTRSEHH